MRLLGYPLTETLGFADRVRPCDDPVLDWRYLPGLKFKSGPVTVSYNSNGFRDREHTRFKPNGIKRAVVLGDSIQEWAPLRSEALLTSQLEKRLPGHWEAINLSMAGLNLDQKLHILETEGIAFGPDLVVLNMSLRDMGGPSALQPSLKWLATKTSNFSRLGASVGLQLKLFLRSFAISELGVLVVERIRSTTGSPDTSFESIWKKEGVLEKLKSGLCRFRTSAKSIGASPIAVIWPVMTDFTNYPYEPIHEMVRLASNQCGLVLLDLLPVFKAAGLQAIQFNRLDAMHGSALSHELASRAIEAKLRENPRQENGRSLSSPQSP
ncbi:MAG: hypothetical protein KDD51_14830 [Bdellovibrionales bacterium]|nr:hypothetical protein [Bdellovibrionales bacterium]